MRTLTRAVVASMAAASLIGFMIPAATAATRPAGPLTRYDICSANGCLENEGNDNATSLSTPGTGYSNEYSTTWDGHTVNAWSSPDGNCLQAYEATMREVACNDGADELFYIAASGALVSDGQSGQNGHLACAQGLVTDVTYFVNCPAGTPEPDEQWSLG
jgi:hypothetical protein